MTAAASLAGALEEHGIAVLAELVDSGTLAFLRKATASLADGSPMRGGVRNVLGLSADLRTFATGGPVAATAAALLGSEAQPIKLTLFDKRVRANWKVPWHQDLTITVRERHDAAGFGPWSVKDGVPHVQPPVAVLKQVLAIRLHLDDTPAENGALRVLPGTHVLGRLSAERIAELRNERREVVCPVPAGGAMLMSPLLLHASSPASSPTQCRVLHFEYSAARLPEPLAWAQGWRVTTIAGADRGSVDEA